MFLNPILEGYITYADLKNGTLNLYDLYVMNELIEFKQRVQNEQIRAEKRKRALK